MLNEGDKVTLVSSATEGELRRQCRWCARPEDRAKQTKKGALQNEPRKNNESVSPKGLADSIVLR